MWTQPQGLRSTKVRMVPEVLEEDFGKDNDIMPRPGRKWKDIVVRIYDLNNEMREKIYIDQTGHFPTRSSRGNQYIMVMCEMDSDAILFEAMKNRTAGEMVRAYQALIDKLASCGIHPKHHALDNEISEEFKSAIKRNNMTYQQVPHDDQRRNIAERSIQIKLAKVVWFPC